MNFRRLMALAVALCMLASFAGTFAFAVEEENNSTDLIIEKLDSDAVNLDLAQNGNVNSDHVLEPEVIDEDEMVRVVVVMEGESIIEMNADAVVDNETAAQAAEMEQAQADVIAEIESTILNGEKLDVSYNFTWLVNGFAAQVPYGAIKDIAEITGVKNVVRQVVYTVCNTPGVALPHTIHDGVTIGRESAWGKGYTGEGMKIAIVDTGLDLDHQNFAALSADKLTDTSADEGTVANVLASLNASARYEGLTTSDVYYNTKVVFGFNYCDDNLNVTHDHDNKGDHGTHVAGIAAANKVDGSDVVGVAPDAQLYVMKVFGEDGGAYTDDIVAALEDALKLGADVINMSLGSPAGFASGDMLADGTLLDPIYESISETDTVLVVSAGNSYTSGYGNQWGTNQNLTYYPDNGIVGSPGTYTNAMTVASVENSMVERYYIDADGYYFAYSDSFEYGPDMLTTLTGAYEVVAIGGYGEPADYEGLDVAGKVALVSRGVTSFVEKHETAHAAGAVATIVYNTEPGEMGMDLTNDTATSPCVMINMADGQYLLSALAENPELKLSFPEATKYFPHPYAGTMSDFSSWGPAPDLSLDPDISAPGGYIYSTVNNGEYGTMSGTSMAAPNIAGMSALVLQYVKENFPAGTDYRTIAQNLLMSTAVPVMNEEVGALYSPRNQGSGVANVFSAITTKAYLTVDGMEVPKVELGDDPARTGAYSFSYNVTNFGTSNLFYDLAATVQTEHVDNYGGGLSFMNGKPLALDASTAHSTDSMVLVHDVDNDDAANSHDAYLIYRAAIGESENEDWTCESFRYDVDGSETVATDDVQAYLDALVGNESVADLEAEVFMVAAGETAVVTVEIALADFDKAVFGYYYPNGGYVEGFATLTALNSDSVSLSLPYLGFYGNWNDAPVLDTGSYWEFYSADYDGSMPVGNQYPHVVFTEFDGDNYGFYPGLNAYIEDEPFDLAHISLSPNGDGYADTISDLHLSLMRNAGELNFYYTNAETGEEYYAVGGTNIPKSYFAAAYGQIIPFMGTSYLGSIYDVSNLPNNTKLLLTVEAIGVGESAEDAEYWQVPITIDTEAPILESAVRTEDPETGRTTLSLTFKDNLSVSAIGLVDSTGTMAYLIEGTEDSDPDENGYVNYTKTYDITGMTGKLIILLGDYALNEAYYGINLAGEGASYGDLVAYQYNFETGVNTWVSFNEDVEQNETSIFLQSNLDFVAAEYVGGYVFAQTDSGALYGFRYEDMLRNTMDLESTYIAQLDNVYQDFAYSYAEGKLYGLLTYEEEGYPTAELYSINLNGEYFDENMFQNVAPYQEDWILSRGGVYGLTLAVDDAGTVYVLGPNFDWDTEAMTETAHLWSVGMEYDEWSGTSMLGSRLMEIGDTGLTADFLQSMTWDHNAEKLYWARFMPVGVFDLECELIEIDPADLTTTEDGLTTVGCKKVGTLSGETCALFAPLSEEAAAKDEHANIPAMDPSVVGTPILRDNVVTMNVSGMKKLSYDLDPWYTDYKEVVWSSDNESVATVDENGVITAVNSGSAVITVANKADESKFDTVTVEVTALDLKIEGVVAAMGEGIGSVNGVSTYEFNMVNGISSMEYINPITAPKELNFGLSLATTAYGRGSMWASEFGNTGMVYEIDPETGVVKDVLQPVDGDMLFGLTYNEALDTFTGIMNFYMFVDLPMTHAMEEEMKGSYDEEKGMYMWHRLNMLPYLLEAGEGITTGETGQGASSEVVFCGITTMPADGTSRYMYTDYMGGYGPEITYTADQTLVLLDNVGRLWYIDEVTGLTGETDECGNNLYFNAEGTAMLTDQFHGVELQERIAEDGTVTYNAFIIRELQETPLTDMFREGSMPRITYHFSDIEFAGFTAEGAPMFAMSLYDYWNNAITNELYLFVGGVGTGEFEWDENWNRVEIKTPDRMYSLGNTGEYSIIASINKVEVTGGLEDGSSNDDFVEVFSAKPLTVGVYSK